MRYRHNVDGSLTEIPPDACPNGHAWGSGRYLVGWETAREGRPGHRTWTCQECWTTIHDEP